MPTNDPPKLVLCHECGRRVEPYTVGRPICRDCYERAEARAMRPNTRPAHEIEGEKIA